MAFQIQPMTVEDYDDVLRLWKRTEGIGLDERVDTRQGIAEYLSRNASLSYVARQDGQIVGVVLCGHDGRRGYLHHLAVAVPQRRNGIAHALVDACLRALGAAGIVKCNIFLFIDNEPGEVFWKKCGWTERGDLRVLQHATATPSSSRP